MKSKPLPVSFHNIIPVMLCVNDHRNGLANGYCDDLRFSGSGGDEIEVECQVKFNEFKSAFRFGRLHIPFEKSQSWVGNWCWNQYHIRQHHLAKMLEYLRKNEVGGLQVAPEWFWDEWTIGRDMDDMLAGLFQEEV